MNDPGRTLFWSFPVGFYDNLGVKWLFVRVGDSGELRDLPFEGQPVHPLDVPCDTQIDRTLHVNLDEILDVSSHRIPDISMGRDGSDDSNDAISGKELRDKADASEVRFAIFSAEAQALGEVGPDHVTVQDLDLVASPSQFPLDDVRERRLARTR